MLPAAHVRKKTITTAKKRSRCKKCKKPPVNKVNAQKKEDSKKQQGVAGKNTLPKMEQNWSKERSANFLNKRKRMDKSQKDQQPAQPEINAGQNPTLKEAGASVPDYGNVMGGASEETVRQGGEESRQENEHRSGGANDTLGNP